MIKRKYLVLVPTKNRPKRIQYAIKTFYEQCQKEKIDFLFIIEKTDKVLNLVPKEIGVVKLPKSNQGLGYVRMKGIEFANSNRYSHVLMIDDNVTFNKKRPPMFKKFLDCINKDTKFLAAWNKYYELVGSMWGACFGIDIKSAIKVGNYDPNLTYGEDKFMLVKLSKEYGVNCFKTSNLIEFGKKRFEEGGGTFLRTKGKYNKVIKYINKNYSDLFRKIYINKNNSMIMLPTFKLRKTHKPDFKRK